MSVEKKWLETTWMSHKFAKNDDSVFRPICTEVSLSSTFVVVCPLCSFVFCKKILAKIALIAGWVCCISDRGAIFFCDHSELKLLFIVALIRVQGRLCLPRNYLHPVGEKNSEKGQTVQSLSKHIVHFSKNSKILDFKPFDFRLLFCAENIRGTSTTRCKYFVTCSKTAEIRKCCGEDFSKSHLLNSQVPRPGI